MISLLLALVVSQSQVCIQDEGVNKGCAPYLNFTGTGVTATVSGKIGTVAVSGGGGGSTSLPQFDFYQAAVCRADGAVQWANPTGPAIYTLWHTIGNTYIVRPGGGQSCVATLNTPGFTKLLCGSKLIFPALFEMQTRLDIPSTSNAFSTVGNLHWFGLQEDGGGCGHFNSTTGGTGNIIGFRYALGTDATLKGCTRNGTGSLNCCNTGFTPANDSILTLRLKRTIAGVDFYVNGTLKCSQNTDVPNGNEGFPCYGYTNATSATAASTLYFEHIAHSYNPRE